MTTPVNLRTAAARAVLGAFLLVHAMAARAQFTQQGAKLVGSGAAAGTEQGFSGSLSADGNTAIVGGEGDNADAGAAWVFTRSGGVWTQQGAKLVGSGAVGNAWQGASVSLSADGNTAIVGGWDDNSGAGAAWIWTRSGGVWTQQGSKLVGSGAVGNAEQGQSVSLSADGNTAIVGGSQDNTDAGAAWVFTRSGGVWTQQGAKLVGSGGVGGTWQGFSVSLSADGNTAIVGGYRDNGFAGAVWVWTRSGGVWTQQGTKLVGTGAVGNAHQGESVALSADGNTAIVGGQADSANAGAVWIWTRSGGVWTQQGAKLVGSGAAGTAQQGFSVSLSADGNTAIVGGNTDNGGAGASWIWTRSGGVWTQQGSKLVGTGAVGAATQGSAVSLSSDGSTAIVGGVQDNGYVGASWVFTASTPAPATHLGFVQQPTNAVAGQAIAPAVTAQLLDAANAPVAQAGTSITLALGSGTGTLSGTATQVTNASGLATFAGLSVDLSGTKTLSATSAGLTGATSATFVISAAAATALAITGGNVQHTPIGTAFAVPLQATVTDTFGNPVTGVSVTFTPPASGASAAIAGSPATTDASGVASVTATANGTAGSYLVTAAAGTLPPRGFSLTNDPAAPAAAVAVPTLGTTGLALLGIALAAAALRALRR